MDFDLRAALPARRSSRRSALERWRSVTRGGSASPSDISYPQCNGTFPSDAAFAIVGVNVGIVYSPNPCLTSELAWAGMDAALYANTANPGAHFLLPLADRANRELFDARQRLSDCDGRIRVGEGLRPCDRCSAAGTDQVRADDLEPRGASTRRLRQRDRLPANPQEPAQAA